MSVPLGRTHVFKSAIQFTQCFSMNVMYQTIGATGLLTVICELGSHTVSL